MNKKIKIPFAKQKAKQRGKVSMLCMVCILFLAGSFSACSQKTDNDCNGEPASFIGKWKLVKSVGGYGFVTDLSKYNIVYEFHPNGILTITGALDDARFKSGDYLYSIVEDVDVEDYYFYVCCYYPYCGIEYGVHIKIDDIVFFNTVNAISCKEMSMQFMSQYTNIDYLIFKKIKK